MLSDKERRHVVADVASELDVVVTWNHPVFVAVVANERVLGCTAQMVAERLVQGLEGALASRKTALRNGVTEAVNEEIARLTKGAAGARGLVQKTGSAWAVGLGVLGLVEALAIWALMRGG